MSWTACRWRCGGGSAAATAAAAPAAWRRLLPRSPPVLSILVRRTTAAAPAATWSSRAAVAGSRVIASSGGGDRRAHGQRMTERKVQPVLTRAISYTQQRRPPPRQLRRPLSSSTQPSSSSSSSSHTFKQEQPHVRPIHIGKRLEAFKFLLYLAGPVLLVITMQQPEFYEWLMKKTRYVTSTAYTAKQQRDLATRTAKWHEDFKKAKELGLDVSVVQDPDGALLRRGRGPGDRTRTGQASATT